MKKSLIVSLLVVTGSFCLAHEVSAVACNRVTCAYTRGLQACILEKSYGNYTDIDNGGDSKCAAAANTLCQKNNCDLSSISFDCSDAPDCQQ